MKLSSISMAALASVFIASCASDPEIAADKTAVKAEVAEAKDAADTLTDAASDALCLGAGPQTPRDISNGIGLNKVTFPKAPAASELNLCNIHTHTNAEHKGPGFSVFVDGSDHGGYACNGTADLTAEELAAPTVNAGKFKGVKPGDTIEVHWVHSSCADITPGEGLGSCLSETCTDPLLRVEAQTFLVVNDADAKDFNDFAYAGTKRDGFYQAKSLPTGTGTPIEFLGSTTGPSYTQSTCSPMKVTWSVRPQCEKLDINSLNDWAVEGNVFNETKSHGVRQLVTAPELLSPIK